MRQGHSHSYDREAKPSNWPLQQAIKVLLSKTRVTKGGLTMLTTNPHKSDVRKTAFQDLNAVKKLKILATKPYDLTLEGHLSPERIHQYCSQGAGYQLFYATERVNDETISALKELVIESQAVEQMSSMQAGDIVNYIEGYPSENREALHTATRDFFEDPNGSPPAVEAAKLARKEVDKLKRFTSEIEKENKWKSLLLVGIGGSELGPKAHYEALLAYKKSEKSAYFLSNIDPDALALTLREVDLATTLVLVISKTGTTLETVTNEKILRSYYEKANLDPKQHFISITCEKSPLDNRQLYREVFYMWEWIGGRYSTTSMVGGVLLAFVFGFDVFWELLKGANSMDKAALNKSIEQNPALLAALLGIWNRDFLGHPILGIIPYSEPLKRFPAHIQQLDMESNGKQIDKRGNKISFESGPIIFGEPGTSSQHSFYQLIHQGTTVIPLELIAYREPQINEDSEVAGTTSQQKLLANVLAQAIALATGQTSDNPNKNFPGNRPSHLLLGRKLSPFALGALLAFFEHKVAFQGFIWQVNSFDQEGVQLGKVLANRILERFARKGSPYLVGDAFINELNTYPEP